MKAPPEGHGKNNRDKLDNQISGRYGFAAVTAVPHKNDITYNRLEIPGLAAHAWLVVHMEKIGDGYNLEILDSNIASKTEIYTYREGDTHLRLNHLNVDFVPYLDQRNEMDFIKESITTQCKSK